MTAPTTTAPAPARTAGPERDGVLTGTGTLVRFLLRRDRVRLPAWAAGFGLLMLYLAAAIPVAYGTDDELLGAAQLFHDPVGRMLTGPGYGFGEPTVERFIAGGYSLYFLLLAALMSILLISRHTRVEEQTGRAELVRANVVGRHAALTAALLVAVLTNLSASVAVLLVMLVVGEFAVAGSLLFAAGVAAVGLAFAGLTAMTVQVTEYSRAAAGLAGAGLGVAFVLRAGGDMAEEGGTLLSWLSPLAWGQQTAPFVLDRWWPLALALAFAGVTAGAGHLLSNRRDLGMSLVAVRPGRPRGKPSLGTPWGLALRLQRASIIGWSIALAIGGVVFGAYADALQAALADMPEAFVELFGDAEEILGGYLSYMAVFMAFVVGAYAILAVQSLRSEETSDRAEPVLATPVSRWAWLGANLAVTAGGVVLLMAITGLGTGVGAAIVTGDGSHVVDLVLAHLNHVPAVLVVLGIAALLFGVLPRAIPATWTIVAYGMFVGTFGPLLEVPEGAYGLSPFEHAAQPPLEPVAVAPLALLVLLAVAAATVGLLAFRRRDIDST
jgi:ABC-2 type transport system permease protein